MLLSVAPLFFKSMKRFDVITIFPELIDSFAKESLLQKASNKGILKVDAHDMREWAGNKHDSVDDKPFGGGLGMVMRVGPVHRAVKGLKTKNSRVIFFSPRGKRFDQRKAFELSKYDQLIFICGRYEGVDERVPKKLADDVISIGNFDLMGGEVASMAVIETVARLVPGVIGKEEFLKERMMDAGEFIEYPQYTRPEVFEPEPGVKWKVPKVMVSGNHKEIEEWRRKKRKVIK